jgi:hypothetical protein
MFTIRTSDFKDSKRWEFKSERAIQVRQAGVHGGYPSARTLTCSNETWANPYYFYHLTDLYPNRTDVVQSDLDLNDTASSAWITTTQAKLKVFACYDKKVVEKTIGNLAKPPLKNPETS